MTREVFPIPKTSSRPRERRQRRSTAAHHLAYVASLPCCIAGCGKRSTVHHLRCLGSDAAAGRRSSDRFAVPLCSDHHQGNAGVHRHGEAAFWPGHGIDPLALAARLWRESHGEPMP